MPLGQSEVQNGRLVAMAGLLGDAAWELDLFGQGSRRSVSL
jgi:hypothetical protein